MRITRTSWTVLLTIVLATCGSMTEAQQPAAADIQPRPELALTYTFVHANAPPGACGCFAMNGGSADFAWPTRRRGIALVGDVTAAHTNSTGSSNASLTLSTFTAGVRYSPPFKHSRYQPFGQVVIGLGHASGSLVQDTQSQSAASSNAFAANVGGGLDARVNRRLAVRVFEADYLVTTFSNGVNDHQNLLRLSSGIVLRF